VSDYTALSRAELIAECERLRTEIETRDASFNLRWRADQRAIKRWQEAHPGNDLVWPDHADMVVWLMDECERLRHDAIAYLGALGRGIPDGHNGLLSDGTAPKNVLADYIQNNGPFRSPAAETEEAK